MMARNVTLDQMQRALERANHLYNGNLKFLGPTPKGKGFNFRLGVFSSKAPGHRVGHSGRRISAACWHAHRDFMAALFETVPDAVIISSQARYDGAIDFLKKFPATGKVNIGSVMQPLHYEWACECGIRRREQPFPFFGIISNREFVAGRSRP